MALLLCAMLCAVLPAVATAAAVGAEPHIPPSPFAPGAVLVNHLGCEGADIELGPPSRTSASGGTTFAYWAMGCDFVGSAPLRLRLNDTVSDYGAGPVSAPHETTVARVVLVSRSRFEARGGVEVAGPTHAHAAMPHTTDWSELWGASPLNVTISNNTFAAGAVIRFVGALPSRSSLLIAGNTFADAWLLSASGAFAAGNIFDSYGATTSSMPLHVLVLVTPHSIDGGQWYGRDRLYLSATIAPPQKDLDGMRV